MISYRLEEPIPQSVDFKREKADFDALLSASRAKYRDCAYALIEKKDNGPVTKTHIYTFNKD